MKYFIITFHNPDPGFDVCAISGFHSQRLTEKTFLFNTGKDIGPMRTEFRSYDSAVDFKEITAAEYEEIARSSDLYAPLTDCED